MRTAPKSIVLGVGGTGRLAGCLGVIRVINRGCPPSDRTKKPDPVDFRKYITWRINKLKKIDILIGTTGSSRLSRKMRRQRWLGAVGVSLNREGEGGRGFQDSDGSIGRTSLPYRTATSLPGPDRAFTSRVKCLEVVEMGFILDSGRCGVLPANTHGHWNNLRRAASLSAGWRQSYPPWTVIDWSV